jgi:hypothetical protein
MMTNITNLSTKIITAIIIILSMIMAVVGTTTPSSPVQAQLSVEPQPENMTTSATNMTTQEGFFCYNCLNITATGANTTTDVTNATAVNAATTTTNATSTKQ